jgi:hypothetical protein
MPQIILGLRRRAVRKGSAFSINAEFHEATPHACHLKKRSLPGQVPGVGLPENESLLMDLNRIR